MIYPYNGMSAIKSNEVLIQATTWMKPENSVVKRAKRKGHILYYSANMKYSLQVNSHKQKQVSACQRKWGWARKITADGYRMFLQGEKNFLKLRSADSCTTP